MSGVPVFSGRAHTRHRAIPETLVLGVRAGARPSDAAPVRIFLGTEPAQYRAERVFLWSIEQVRDPGRVYEIHRMEDLAGFQSRLWNTAFTNYRFAIPHFAGHRGRAIYNDVDQVYLADPGLLFDMDLADHGCLSVSETDTSVMLIDCEAMGRLWTLHGARRHRKRRLIESARRVAGTIGALPPSWNARDHEHVPGRTRLLHYTTLHKQPWRPFPERFYYQPNPVAGLWHDLESAADAAGYRVPAGDAVVTRVVAADDALTRDPEFALEVDELVARTGSRRAVEVIPFAKGEGGAKGEGKKGAEADQASHEGVICGVRLDLLPHRERQGAVDELFARAERFVFAAVRDDRTARPRLRRSPRGTLGAPSYWERLFRTASARYPGVHWRVEIRRRSRVEWIQGGAFPGADQGALPRVWILTDHKPGHTTQSEGLAAELGWPTERIDLSYGPLQELPNAWTRKSLATLTRASAEALKPPWPDLVIATGRRTAPVAGWIRAQSRDRCLTVQMGRIGAFHGDVFDLAVAPAYACLYPDARRIETAAPVTRVSPSRLESAAKQWAPVLAAAPTPRLALLVGGRDAEHELRPAQARALGEAVAELARREGGSVLATTSRRTSPRVASALEEGLGETCAHFHLWSADAGPEENPYLGYLALADALVVTGESASMLAEACSTGKPVYIHPLAETSTGPRNWVRRAERWLAKRVTERAYARPVNRRNFERPQSGLERACAMLLARGFVRSSGHSRRLHEVLIERGLARIFDGKLAPPPTERLSDLQIVAERVRQRIGIADAEAPRPR
jgi:mitochondrial fission protein ELM1